ncbi:MAG TPA: trehalase family glycosidase [Terriglobales bacterium]|nr:trehalase family glycosidase [Terriglobales bacterium]
MLILTLLFALSGAASAQAQQANNISDLLAYIDQSWDALTRSPLDCKTVLDVRVPEHSLLYLPVDYPEPASVKELQAKCKIAVEHLPQRITSLGSLNMDNSPRQGVLYLPNPYVVPGGFLNEMYGWDSYFIMVGLLRAGRLELARGMVENFFFEIEHYGGILNANRTYFLTRSQPPFLSSMVMALYEALPDPDTKRLWLEKSYPFIQRDHDMWTSGEKLAGNTGLSRYFDYGEGPVPEIATMHDPYYRDVFRHLQASLQAKEYLGEPGKSSAKLIGPSFTFAFCQQDASDLPKSCERSPVNQFTADYYKGDRAMRESGFDISFRFGNFSGSTHHYAPVCLNSLLYKEEMDMASISKLLGKTAEAGQWTRRAQHRKELINRYLWNAQSGMYFDYDFTKGEQSKYQYATTFYPLWVGAASPLQAKAVMASLKNFEHKGGIAMSPYETGVQWDLPYGWAPVNFIDVEGMGRYGFKQDADRVSREWINTVATNFRKDNTIREKYDVVSSTKEFSVTAGYKENVVGFGWTNAVVLEFAYQLGMTPGKAKAAGAQ